MPDRPGLRIIVVGAGGIGCALGHALRAGGLGVTFIDADERKIAWGRAHGVGLEGRASHHAEFEHFDDWRPEAGDTILLCTKCYDNGAVLERVARSIGVIPVQNGFDQRVMERSDIEGIASFVSECDPCRTHTRITRAGTLHIGPVGQQGAGACKGEACAREPVERMIGALERHGAFKVEQVPDVLPYKHAKLMYNAAISPLAAVAGLDNGQLLTHTPARSLFFALLRENYAILKRARVALGRVGPFHPDTVDRILRWPLVARSMAGPFSRTLRGTYCSMSGDIPKGRTEIDNFNGYLIDLAKGHGCDLNRCVHALVSSMAQARRTPGLHWLDEIRV